MRVLLVLATALIALGAAPAMADVDVRPDDRKPDHIFIDVERVGERADTPHTTPVKGSKPKPRPRLDCRVDAEILKYGCRTYRPADPDDAELSEGDIVQAVRQIGLPSLEVQIQPGTSTLVNVATSWALSGGVDRHSYPEPLGERDWGNASVSTNECVGLDSCPFAEQCRPAEAREIAAEAQIIVTNHSMLAVQAANDAPVVIGNQRLGQFDHVIVDEAHALPSIVRNQGAVEISGRKITNLMYVLRGLMSEQATKTEKNLLDDGDRLAHALDLHLEHICIDLKPPRARSRRRRCRRRCRRHALRGPPTPTRRSQP